MEIIVSLLRSNKKSRLKSKRLFTAVVDSYPKVGLISMR
jgi:hypothetical protein